MLISIDLLILIVLWTKDHFNEFDISSLLDFGRNWGFTGTLFSLRYTVYCFESFPLMLLISLLHCISFSYKTFFQIEISCSVWKTLLMSNLLVPCPLFTGIWTKYARRLDCLAVITHSTATWSLCTVILVNCSQLQRMGCCCPCAHCWRWKQT